MQERCRFSVFLLCSPCGSHIPRRNKLVAENFPGEGDRPQNDRLVILKEEFEKNVLEVKRVSDRLMSLKLEIEGVMLNVIIAYAPQVGCKQEEKDTFWSELEEVMQTVPRGERVERNPEGQRLVDFAKSMEMAVVNTYSQKRQEHRVTYKSGGRSTQVDYILCRRCNLMEISDCKVVVGESVARQHRMVVCKITLVVRKMKKAKAEQKTKWWKLEKEECCVDHLKLVRRCFQMTGLLQPK
ncbi:hypothetical protein DPX16_0452 [Anabarilius grahami]|uniref:Craniofacial development protein 2 n=1 Tax=Anabarilius grahami TaxID=495550 RepID=A0A3N0XH35_ANAGA|nr:hypothetical protein DPX16_0452 [Anabarilius grahami]